MENIELKSVIDSLGTAFAEYKKANDERIEAVAKSANVGELTEKMAKIEKDIASLEESKSAMEAKMNRPSNMGNKSADEVEYKKEFDNWARKGVEGSLSMKDVNIATGADGGFAVPTELSSTIYSLLQSGEPMRQACRVITVGTPNYYELVNVHGSAASWVGETDPRNGTQNPQLARVTPAWGEIYANPMASQYSLDDIFFDVENWLSSEVASEFAAAENAAFTNGDGSNKPVGLFACPTSAQKDKARSFGTLQFVKTGASGAFGANPYDNLIDLIAELKTGHLNGAKFMMNRSTLAQLRKVKDANGNYIWQPSMIEGQPSLLMGYEVILNDDMDDIAADSFSVAFGNFFNAYTIVDRVGIRVTRDPYSNKPMVGFYTTKRTGGFLKDSEAVKLLKFSA